MNTETVARQEAHVAAEAISYAIGSTAIGKALVAQSESGVCAILLGDTDEQVRVELGATFPAARLSEDRNGLKAVLDQVALFIEDPVLGLGVQLDVRGTLFQQQVWKALRDIPAGETVSYAEVAERVGQPDAPRAVAGACAANVLAVAIPCHRVVCGDGSLSGYRWGVERKRELLRRESRA